jgi:predicted patatin/cPLA2 family phospholipase
MLETYISKLVDNIPLSKKSQREKIDIILDGGLFNGSYLIGALYFLREMEKNGYVEVDKLSGCSIGSLACVLYTADLLDLTTEIYNMAIDQFKKTTHLEVVDDILSKIHKKLPPDICKRMNGRVFITYYDLKKGKKIVKSKYKNKKEIIDVVKRSCFVPYLIDGNFMHKERYVDGIFPHILPKEKGKRILYLDLLGYDKITHIISVKNEKTNFHRVLSGLLDIHLFYIKQQPTLMCSYVDEWSLVRQTYHFIIKKIFEILIFYNIYFYYLIHKYILTREVLEHLNSNSSVQIVIEFLKNANEKFLRYFCM